ncbi:MAG: chemotaxis protein CheW, partial [Gemmatimonadales bacterium]
IGGTVDLDSRIDKGTALKIKIPLTLAIIPALVVTCREERFAIPQVSLLELVRLEGEAAARSIERIHGTPVYRLRGNLLPLVYLDEVLEVGQRCGAASDIINMVVLQADDRQFGLVVDRVNDTEEIVVKPLGKQLKGINAFAGATIMGDGKVALILDVLGLAQRAHVVSERRDQTVIDEQQARAASEAGGERQTLLLFRAGEQDRLGVPLGLVARLEEFPLEKLERGGGCEVVQYRDQILPLVRLASVLGLGAPPVRDPAQVIVFTEGERRIGLLVDQIIDIVQGRITTKSEARRPGVLGLAVIGGRVTEMIDLQEVIAQAAPEWFLGAGPWRPGPARASACCWERIRPSCGAFCGPSSKWPATRWWKRRTARRRSKNSDKSESTWC